MSREAWGVSKVCAPILLAACVAAGAAGRVAPAQDEAVRPAPPAPVWDAGERRAELAARRARVMEFAGPKSVVVLFSAEPRVYAGDVDYEFRQENNLFYLTHLNQPGATLVLMPGHARHRELLFLPRRNPATEVWEGAKYSAEDARALSGVAEIWEAAEFEPFMRALRQGRGYRPRAESILLSDSQPSTTRPGQTMNQQPGQQTNQQPSPQPVQTPTPQPAQTPTPQPGQASGAQGAAGYEVLLAAVAADEASLYLLLPSERESREFRREQEFAANWAKSDTGLTLRNVWPVFNRLRQIKSPAEVRLIQHAVDITAEGLGRAARAALRGARREYEVEAEIDYTFRRRGADNWGYPSIVGCGANATVLHYTSSAGACAPGDLLLMDVGAEVGHYSADVTRTFPVAGRFTPEQADIYNAVFAAQEAAMRAARPGATLMDVHNAAADSLRDSLLKLGLITERNSTQYGVWFMHGTSHWLGLNVHDVGAFGRRLEPGMVFTIEPGLYVRADALDRLPDTPEARRFAAAVRPAFEKYRNIGVRIEDDVLITAEGHRNLSAAIPRALAEVEAFMSRLK